MEQVNICGGRVPEVEVNGWRYLKMPLDALSGGAWDSACESVKRELWSGLKRRGLTMAPLES